MRRVARRKAALVFKGEKSHLVVKLKAGWSFNPARRLFISKDGRRLSPGRNLPKNSRIVHMTPGLARTPPEALSEDEQILARYLQVILPKGKRPSAHLAAIRKWECVEEVTLPPQISLP